MAIFSIQYLKWQYGPVIFCLDCDHYLEMAIWPSDILPRLRSSRIKNEIRMKEVQL